MNNNSARSELALFRIAHETFGIEIAAIQEIKRAPRLTKVPGADVCVKGVMNLRGDIVTVLDLSKRLGYGEVTSTDTTRVLVINYRDENIGLLVDEIKDIVPIDLGRVNPWAIAKEGVDSAFCAGVYMHDESLIIVLDMAKVIFEGEASSSINQYNRIKSKELIT